MNVMLTDTEDKLLRLLFVHHKIERIEFERNYTLLGKERHDIGRVEGDKLSVSYPVRAIRTDQYLYIKNFIPSRWPVGNPEYGLLNCDNSPTKSHLISLKEFYQ